MDTSHLKVARTQDTSHSRLHFARSTRTISAEGCPREVNQSHSRLCFARSTRTISAEGCAATGQVALSPAFRALDMHDLRRGLRGHRTNRTLACISRTRHARFRALDMHDLRRGLRGHRTNGTLACISRTRHARFRALDTHDLRRGLRGYRSSRALACISRTRHARSPQRVAFSVDAVRPTLRL